MTVIFSSSACVILATSESCCMSHPRCTCSSLYMQLVKALVSCPDHFHLHLSVFISSMVLVSIWNNEAKTVLRAYLTFPLSWYPLCYCIKSKLLGLVVFFFNSLFGLFSAALIPVYCVVLAFMCISHCAGFYDVHSRSTLCTFSEYQATSVRAAVGILG